MLNLNVDLFMQEEPRAPIPEKIPWYKKFNWGSILWSMTGAYGGVMLTHPANVKTAFVIFFLLIHGGTDEF